MSTSTPQSDLTAAEASISTLQSQLAGVGTSLSNAAKAKTLKGALSSITTGQSRLTVAQGTLGTVLSDVQAALAAISTPPAPPAPTYPSGITPPETPSGYTVAAFDDFTASTLSSIWSAPYNGQSEAKYPGYFIDKHCVMLGDSLLRLQAYPDPANIVNCWKYTAAIAASVNQWGGAGIQTVTRWPVGTRFVFAARWDTYPAITPIALTMGNDWPPEQDIIEANVSTRGQAVTTFTESFHYDQGNSQQQLQVADGTDYSSWHLWEIDWTEQGTTVKCDRIQIADCPFTELMVVDPDYGLAADQFLAFQIQTGDPNNPAADATVTVEAPVEFCIDWLQVLTPTTTPVPQPVGIPGNWNLIFDDEFAGTELDASKWRPGWWPNSAGLSDPVNTLEVAAYSEANVTVDNGLSLALTSQSITAPNGKTYPFTGALVSTDPQTASPAGGGFEYTYGVFEAKVFLPDNDSGEIADWPGIWATSLPNGTYQEDDILEGLGGQAAYHFHDSTNGGPGADVPSIKPGWHTVSSNWTPTEIVYYYDGVQVGSEPCPAAAGPMYLILDMTTSDAATAVDTALQVAYVRVWQAA